MPDNKNISAMPVKIKKEYRLISLLSFHQNAIVLSLEKKKITSKKTSYTIHPDSSQVVMKIMPKSYFDEALFSALQSLHHPLLLLPTELFTEKDYVYALYPKLLPFSDYLLGGKISLSTIQQWVRDMSQILSCLHDKNIFHGDISPSNIYMNDEGHFFLGDFSSSRIASSHYSTTYRNNKNKTGATFPFSPVADHKQDIFSFLTILSKLLEAALSAKKNNSAILSALRDKTETLLLELKEKKHFTMSFRKACQLILSVIEENQKEMKSSHPDFILAADKLDFLREATKTLKKNSISSPVPFQTKKLLPLFALALCTLIFLTAAIYYAGVGILPQKKNSLARELISEEISSAANTATESPPEHATATDTPKTDNPSKSFLDISYKKYQNIPSSLRADSSIKIIFAQGNQLKKLCLFSDYPALEELYLDGNAISDLSNLSAFQHLAVLGLSNNKVTDLSSLRDIPSLQILDLSGHGKLSNFPSLGKLKNLEYLILTETNATDHDVQSLQQSLPHCTILY